jgi:hypothetical protein
MGESEAEPRQLEGWDEAEDERPLAEALDSPRGQVVAREPPSDDEYVPM